MFIVKFIFYYHLRREHLQTLFECSCYKKFFDAKFRDSCHKYPNFIQVLSRFRLHSLTKMTVHFLDTTQQHKNNKFIDCI